MTSKSATLKQATDGGVETAESGQAPVHKRIPPEDILNEPNLELLRGLLRCIDSVEEVQEYVAYENQHQQRETVLRLLDQRATALKWAQ